MREGGDRGKEASSLPRDPRSVLGDFGRLWSWEHCSYVPQSRRTQRSVAERGSAPAQSDWALDRYSISSLKRQLSCHRPEAGFRVGLPGYVVLG